MNEIDYIVRYFGSIRYYFYQLNHLVYEWHYYQISQFVSHYTTRLWILCVQWSVSDNGVTRNFDGTFSCMASRAVDDLVDEIRRVMTS